MLNLKSLIVKGLSYVASLTEVKDSNHQTIGYAEITL